MYNKSEWMLWWTSLRYMRTDTDWLLHKGFFLYDFKSHDRLWDFVPRLQMFSSSFFENPLKSWTYLGNSINQVVRMEQNCFEAQMGLEIALKGAQNCSYAQNYWHPDIHANCSLDYMALKTRLHFQPPSSYSQILRLKLIKISQISVSEFNAVWNPKEKKFA